MTNSTRDYAAEYLAACVEARRADTLSVDRRKSNRIAAAARKAGVKIDEIALDEQARVQLYGNTRPSWY